METVTKITNEQLLQLLQKAEITSDMHKETFGDGIENDVDFEIYLSDAEFLSIVKVEGYEKDYDEFLLTIDSEKEEIKDNFSTIEFSEVQTEMIFEAVMLEKQAQTLELRERINEL